MIIMFVSIERVRMESCSGGSVLIHCQAGISRSATVSIAYIMRYLGKTREDAYRFVKEKRPSISPNFSFVHQLDQYEEQLRQENILPPRSAPTTLTAGFLPGIISPSSPSTTSSSLLFTSSSLRSRSPSRMHPYALSLHLPLASSCSFSSPSSSPTTLPVVLSPASGQTNSQTSLFNRKKLLLMIPCTTSGTAVSSSSTSNGSPVTSSPQTAVTPS